MLHSKGFSPDSFSYRLIFLWETTLKQSDNINREGCFLKDWINIDIVFREIKSIYGPFKEKSDLRRYNIKLSRNRNKIHNVIKAKELVVTKY
jgi:hypothetical protein